MKAAKLTEHPGFRLMRQTDVQNVCICRCRDGYFPTRDMRI